MDAVTRKGGLLYPLLVIAAITVIVLSVTGIAAMMGWLPSALSSRTQGPGIEQPVPAGPVNDERFASTPLGAAGEGQGAPAIASAPPACANCGVVESIRAVETHGQSSWLGAAGGAVLGGLLGNQIGSGRGRTAATVVGAGAGAYAGNEIEKNANRSVRYRVRVRMDDGRYRTFHESAQPSYAVGQKVRVTERGIAAAG